jgi:hypothetical protein
VTELLVRTSRAPALVIVIEREAPTRLIELAATDAERAALEAWIDASAPRLAAVISAVEDRRRQGGAHRGFAWMAALRRNGGGIVEAVEALVAPKP